MVERGDNTIVSSRPTVAVDLRALVGSPSGIGLMTRSLLLALSARDGARYIGMSHQPTVADEELASAKVTLEHHPTSWGVLWQQLKLPRRLGRGDVDLFWSPLMTLPVRLPLPGVVTVYDLTPLLLPETHRLKVRLSILPFLSSTLRQARRVVAISEATASDLRTHFPGCADRIRVVYHGIDPEFQPASRDDIDKTRRELGCPEGYVLFSGTLEPRKKVDAVLDAWEALRNSDPRTPPLVLTGPYGWRSRPLLHRIESLRTHGVHYLGRLPRNQQVKIVQAARLLVYPSLYEGFGLPPAEAMACGVPTIVSDRSSLPEVVGDAGLQVDPTAPDKLASAMERVLGDQAFAEELGERGRERARRFSWTTAARLMEEIFLEAVQ